MTDIKNNRLFWEKFRPNTLNDMILPQRIKEVVSHGIITNMLFVGPAGLGKTTLAKILVKDHPYIVKSSKLGVDVLRNEVLSFCQTITSDPFNNVKLKNNKIVYLEEFDGASNTLQEELRAFIEQFEKNIRFVATANNLNKIIKPMQSRFEIFDFTPKNQDEIKYLKVNFAKRMMNIVEENDLKVTGDQIKDIVKKSFPDLRKCMSGLQIADLTGSTNYDLNSEDDIQIYDYANANPKTWNYLYENWLDRLDDAFAMFDRRYWKYVESNKPSELFKMPNRMTVISKYVDVHLANSRDPFITLFAMINELQQI